MFWSVWAISICCEVIFVSGAPFLLEANDPSRLYSGDKGYVTSVEDLNFAGSEQSSSRNRGAADKGFHIGDDEKGYFKAKSSKGKKGYKNLDTFHKKDGDEWEHEEHSGHQKKRNDGDKGGSYHTSSSYKWDSKDGDKKGGVKGKKPAGSHAAYSQFEETGDDDSQYFQNGDDEDGGHYEEHDSEDDHGHQRSYDDDHGDDHRDFSGDDHGDSTGEDRSRDHGGDHDSGSFHNYDGDEDSGSYHQEEEYDSPSNHPQNIEGPSRPLSVGANLGSSAFRGPATFHTRTDPSGNFNTRSQPAEDFQQPTAGVSSYQSGSGGPGGATSYYIRHY